MKKKGSGEEHFIRKLGWQRLEPDTFFVDRGYENWNYISSFGKSPIDKKKPRIPFLPSRSMDVERIESVRNWQWEEKGAYTELCGSLTEVHERAPRVRKYMSLLSRGSSYGRQVVADSVRKFRSFREARSPRIPSRPECRPANERTNEWTNKRTSKQARNSLSCTAKLVACAVRILISAFLR